MPRRTKGYWYDLRPRQIRTDCSFLLVQTLTLDGRLAPASPEMAYAHCLSENGLAK
jgi:hypothetical protein